MSELMMNVHTCSTDSSNNTMMTMPDLMMNVRTCVTVTTTYTMSYLRYRMHKGNDGKDKCILERHDFDGG
jgi:hypothetical protein